MAEGTLAEDAGRLQPSWWRDLGTWARVSLAGVLAAGLLAIGLGWFIPREVEQRFLEAQIEEDQAVLSVLMSTQTLVAGGAPDIEVLDAFVEEAVLRGDFVRLKLWSPGGRVLYSDEHALIGRTFPLGEDLGHVAVSGPISHISNLSADENIFERDLGPTLLETYLPVIEDGEVVALWEVYHALDGLNDAVSGVRLVVWLSVGAGLAILALFMVSAFGNLIATVQRRRREAEARSAELATLLEVARTTTESLDPDDVAQRAVRLLHEAGGYHCVALTRTDADGEVGVLGLAGDESCAAEGHGTDPSECEQQTATADSEGGLLTLVACRPAGAPAQGSGPAVIQGAIEELRLGVERAELYHRVEASRAQLRDVMDRLVSAQEEERQRIVGEVHDGLGQDLHRVLFGIRGLMNATPEEVDAELASLEKLVNQSSRRLRRLLAELHPSVIEDVGLAASLRGLVERMGDDYGLHVELQIEGFSEPPVDVRLSAFRIAQEALQNIVKHSGTLNGELTVTRENGILALRVADFGRGIAKNPGSGLGMWLMRERAETLGGTLSVDSGPMGTVVDARFPVGAAG